MKFLLSLLLSMSFLMAEGADNSTDTTPQKPEVTMLGKIIKIEGKGVAMAKRGAEIFDVKVGQELQKGDRIVTRGFKVVIKKPDETQIILFGTADVVFNSDKLITQNKGKVYYNVSHPVVEGLAKALPIKLEVKTKTATMGIRGTDFVVDNTKPDEESVSLRKGNIEIGLAEEFSLYAKAMKEEFEAYKALMEKEFQEYKDSIYQNFKGEEYKFVEKTSKIEMPETTKIVLSKDKAFKSDFVEDTVKEFEAFDELLGIAPANSTATAPSAN